jgi:hypothetical protein
VVSGGEPDQRYAFEYLVEARDGGSAVLRFVQSGVLGEDWETEYEAMSGGWDLYFHTLGQYLRHFPGRRATFVSAEGPAVSATAQAWPVLLAALGLQGPPAVGDRVRLTGPELLEGVADHVTPNFLGVRTADGLYRFHGRAMLGMTIALGHHLYATEVDQKETERGWQSWLDRTFAR